MADLDDLLEKTSRTFALSIPLLPEPTRREVSVAYLLFRIADTFEDAELWSPKQRKKALADFRELLGQPGRSEAVAEAWARHPPRHHAAHLAPLRAPPPPLQHL